METTLTMGPVRSQLWGPPDIAIAVRELLTVDHPGAKHTPAFKMGRWDGRVRFSSVPKTLQHGIWTLTFPSGLTKRVSDLLLESGLHFSLELNQPSIPAFSGNPADIANCLQGVELRDYQVETVIRALATGRMAIQCPTGSGKTEIGAAIIKMARVMPTLWVVHRKELLHQTYERLAARLGSDGLQWDKPGYEDGIGRLGAGIAEPGFVTVAMVQTLANIPSTDPFWNEWGMLIVDEVHHLSSETWYEMVNQCKQAYYRFGLSGTIVTGHPVRDLKLEGATGPLYVAAKTMDLAEKGYLAKPLVYMLDIGTRHYPSYAEVRQEVCPGWRDNPRQLSTLGGKLFATAYKNGVTHNDKRNATIAGWAAAHAKKGDKVLVLCTRINHGKKILMGIENTDVRGVPVWWLHGKEDDNTRQHALKLFKSQEGGAILVASTIFDEGVDIPEIDALILAGGGESYIKNIQRVGRALRPKMHKDYVVIYDFLDGRDPKDKKDYLAKHTKARIEDYKGQEFQVKRMEV